MSQTGTTLSRIKDITLIYLYELPYSTAEVPYYGLKIVMGKRDVVEMTHRNAQFAAFAARVYDMYHLEAKGGQRVTVVGAKTKAFLSDRQFFQGNTLISTPDHVAEAGHRYPIGDAFADAVLAVLLERLVSVYVGLVEPQARGVTCTFLGGYKDRKSVCCRNGPRDMQLPLRVAQEGDNLYRGEFLYAPVCYAPVRFEVRLGTADAVLSFQQPHPAGEITGTLRFTMAYPDGALCFLEEVKAQQGTILLTDQTALLPATPLDPPQQQALLDFFVLCKVRFDPATVRVYRVGEGVFFVDDLLGDTQPQEQVLADINALVVRRDKTLAIKLAVTHFTYQQQHGLKQILDAADIDIVFRLVETTAVESDFVVCQRYYNASAMANPTYADQLAGRYADTLYRVPYRYDLAQGAAALILAEHAEDFTRQPSIP